MLKQILAGAVSGALAGAGVDLHAYQAAPDKGAFLDTFNWSKALKRWGIGAALGAAGATGLNLGGLLQ